MGSSTRNLVLELPAAERWMAILGIDGPAEVDDAVRLMCDPMRPRLDFPDGSVGGVTCALGLSLLSRAKDMLAEWRRVTCPDGLVASSAFGASAFRPLTDLFSEQLFEYGLAHVAGAATLPWRRFENPEAVGRLVGGVGFAEVDVMSEQLGYYLDDADVWWRILDDSGLSIPLGSLSGQDRDRFKADYLHEVGLLAGGAGIWLDLPLMSVIARK